MSHPSFDGVAEDWMALLDAELAKPETARLFEFLRKETAEQTVYPPESNWFHALKVCSLAQTRVIVLGQDPYHGPGQANGLAFSVSDGVTLPPSLRNIYQELSTDLGTNLPQDGVLNGWAKQGVLLLNTILTVRARQAHSHRGKGWEAITDCVIEELGRRERPLAFVLWGKPAQAKGKQLDRQRHLLIESPHPSPLSAYRGFFGSRPFSRINEWLRANGQSPIDWEARRSFPSS